MNGQINAGRAAEDIFNHFPIDDVQQQMAFIHSTSNHIIIPPGDNTANTNGSILKSEELLLSEQIRSLSAQSENKQLSSSSAALQNEEFAQPNSVQNQSTQNRGNSMRQTSQMAGTSVIVVTPQPRRSQRMSAVTGATTDFDSNAVPQTAAAARIPQQPSIQQNPIEKEEIDLKTAQSQQPLEQRESEGVKLNLSIQEGFEGSQTVKQYQIKNTFGLTSRESRNNSQKIVTSHIAATATTTATTAVATTRRSQMNFVLPTSAISEESNTDATEYSDKSRTKLVEAPSTNSCESDKTATAQVQESQSPEESLSVSELSKLQKEVISKQQTQSKTFQGEANESSEIANPQLTSAVKLSNKEDTTSTWEDTSQQPTQQVGSIQDDKPNKGETQEKPTKSKTTQAATASNINRKRPASSMDDDQASSSQNHRSESRKKSISSENEQDEDNDDSTAEKKGGIKMRRGKLKKRGIRDLSTDEKWAVYTGYEELQSFRGVGRMFNMDHSTVKLLIHRINAEQPDQVMTKELFLLGQIAQPQLEPKITKKQKQEMIRAAKLEEKHAQDLLKKQSIPDNIYLPHFPQGIRQSGEGSQRHNGGDNLNDDQIALDNIEDEEEEEDEEEIQGGGATVRTKKQKRKYNNNIISSAVHQLTDGSGYPYHGQDDMFVDTLNYQQYNDIDASSKERRKSKLAGRQKDQMYAARGGFDESGKPTKKKSKKKTLQESLMFSDDYNNPQELHDELVYLPEYDPSQPHQQGAHGYSQNYQTPGQHGQMMFPHSHSTHHQLQGSTNGVNQQNFQSSLTQNSLGLQTTGLSQDINNLPFEGQLQLISQQEMMYGGVNNNGSGGGSAEYKPNHYENVNGQAILPSYGQHNYEINYEVDLADIQRGGQSQQHQQYGGGQVNNNNDDNDEIQLENL